METATKTVRKKVNVIGASDETQVNIEKCCKLYHDTYGSTISPRILIEKFFNLYSPDEVIKLIDAKYAERRNSRV